MKKLLLILLLTLSITVVATPPQVANALSGSEFQAGRIMDDGVFFNSNGMDVATIQAFLNSKVPSCDTNGAQAYGGTTRAAYGASKGHPAPYTCLRDYRQETPSKASESGLCNSYVGGNKSSAQIIYDIAQSCGISPKALIVLLEKEQSLVTDDWPWDTQYRSATGYGCPDTAPCDAEYYGFFNQVYSAARQFKRYSRDASLFSYRSGRNNYIQYSPNAACGGSDVYIYNQTTAGLYNYTPYQPNASALSNLNGAGDACGAYGNRNFWRIYTEWFGSTFGPTNIVDSPATVSWASGRLDTLVRGADGALWQKTYDAADGGWKPWAKVGGTISSSPAVTTWGAGRLDVFSTNSSGELQHNWYGAGAWHSWESLGSPAPGISLVSAPGAVSWANGRIDIFGRGSDGVLWQKWYDANAGGWQPWARLGGVLNSAPTITNWGVGRLDLFSIGPAGDLQHYWHSNGWRTWESLGTPAPGIKLTYAPGAVSWANGRIDIFGRGSDGVLWQKWYDANAGGWQPWVRFDGVLDSAPTVTSWQPGRIDLFSKGPANDLQHYWHSDGWSTFWESFGKPNSN
ncbi:MAG: hypothetical protein JWO35_153 [Candidatus Saccharibacteria bacterium]|nr:hypothetical protein [Candidatus Saccharibacteria bacterium]